MKKSYIFLVVLFIAIILLFGGGVLFSLRNPSNGYSNSFSDFNKKQNYKKLSYNEIIDLTSSNLNDFKILGIDGIGMGKDKYDLIINLSSYINPCLLMKDSNKNDISYFSNDELLRISIGQVIPKREIIGYFPLLDGYKLIENNNKLNSSDIITTDAYYINEIENKFYDVFGKNDILLNYVDIIDDHKYVNDNYILANDYYVGVYSKNNKNKCQFRKVITNYSINYNGISINYDLINIKNKKTKFNFTEYFNKDNNENYYFSKFIITK